MPIYTVKVDGKTYDLQGDHPPSEAEARDAIGAHQPKMSGVESGSSSSRDPFASARALAGGAPASELWQRAKDHPVQTGTMIGSGIAGGSGGLLTSMLRAAVGAAGGAGYGVAADALQHGPSPSARDDAATVVKAGASGAAGELAGQGVSKVATVAGRGLYRAAALPINKFNKYGDLIKEGLDNAVPISKSGLTQAENMLTQRGAAKSAALADADQRVALRTRAVSTDAGSHLQTYADKMRRAGFPDPGHDVEVRLQAFEKHNPEYMPPSELDSVKSTIDNTTGEAYRKIKAKAPLTPDEQYGVDMSQAQSRAISDVVPEYRQLNRDKMNAEGLRQMIARRVNPNGSGGNQGLENALTMLGGVHAVPARLAMLPPVLSRAGISTYQAGQNPFTADAVRTALLAMIGGGQ